VINSFKKQAKKLYIKYLREGRYIKKGISCSHLWFGNDYGGFYVCPDYLNTKSIVYSFGIGTDISFSKALIAKFNCQVFGFDPTPKSIDWLGKQALPYGFQFFDYGIDKASGLVKFFLPKNPDFVSGSLAAQSNVSTDNYITVKMKRLIDIAKELGHASIDVLKLDVEGSEYEVLDDVLNSGLQIGQILIEFHGRFVPNGKLKTISAIKKLKLAGYEVFAISDSYEEVSFIRKDLI
jgi:FkbM family methyltransferase